MGFVTANAEAGVIIGGQAGISGNPCKMKLSALVLAASGTYTLNVDPAKNSIEDNSGNTITTNMTADNSDASPNLNHFYYLPDPNNNQKQLIIDYPPTQPPQQPQSSYYVGYQFQQQPGTANAQFRAVFWEIGKPFLERYNNAGDWMSLTDPTQQYTSSATWSGGSITSGTTLSITLAPSASTSLRVRETSMVGALVES